jgi:fucose 4-O-acetylase-like acetyltransferase
MKKWLAKAFNTAILEKNRRAWVDYLRGIAIILVVYRHVLIGLEHSDLSVPSSLITLNTIFYSFRMPLFFILSGIFINGSIARRPLRELAYIRFENLIYPYFVWSFIQVTLQILMSRYANSGRTVHDYAQIFYNPHALDQFWYLPALFITTMVFLVLKVKARLPHWAQLLIGLILYYICPMFHDISLFTDWMEFYFYYALGDAISDFFFRQQSQQFLVKRNTLLLAIPLFVASQIYYIQHDPAGQITFFQLAIGLIGCFCMVVLAFHLQKWDVLRFLRVLGFHSLFIYVMHVLVAAFTRIILMKVFGIHNAVFLLFCGILTGVTVPVIFYNLCVKDNFAWFLFTFKSPKKKNSPPARDTGAVSA